MHKQLFLIIIFFIGFSDFVEAQTDVSKTSTQLVLNKNPNHKTITNKNRTIIVNEKINQVDHSKIINYKTSLKYEKERKKTEKEYKSQIIQHKKTNSTGINSNFSNNSIINEKGS